MRFNYTQHGNIITKEKDVEKYFSKLHYILIDPIKEEYTKILPFE